MLIGRLGKGYKTRARQRDGRALVGRKSFFCARATRAREGLFVGAMITFMGPPRVLCREEILYILGRGCHNRVLWPRVT